MTTPRPVRIANCSGFYGDRLARRARDGRRAARSTCSTGDYLAELTMLILCKARQKDPTAGYAHDVPARRWRTCSAPAWTAASRSSPTPAASTRRASRQARASWLRGSAAPRRRLRRRRRPARRHRRPAGRGTAREPRHRQSLADARSTPVTANAYLGGWGIAAALAAGADVVVCRRVTDASLVVGPAAWWHGWAPRRLGRARRRGRRRPRHRVRRRRPPAATTRSSTRSPTDATRASRSPRSPPTAAASSPSTRAPAGWSRSARSPPSCSTRSPARVPQPRRRRALRHDRGSPRRARTGCGHRHARRARRRPR